ncbi:MAG: TetR/AcrR family transcriptional regulator [Deltaproteobacteria bacterium]|nr:TetR/AcrR family transcriptional regulator [Nannocystaceae bacterium]
MGRPRTFDKQEVLRIARDEFWEKGFEATTLDDLMRATGLGKGSLYAAFGDKRQLFLEILEAYSRWRLEGVRRALTGEGRAIERLRAFFSVGDGDTSKGLHARGCLLVNSTTELGDREPAVRKLSRLTYGAVEDMLVDAVSRAMAEKDLPASTDARSFGRLLLAVAQGMEFLGKTGMKASEVAIVGRETIARMLGERPSLRR